MRHRMTPTTRYIPTGYVEVARDDSLGAVAYVGGNPNRLLVIAYSGKRNVRDFHYSYSGNAKASAGERVAKQIKAWLEGLRASKAAKASRTAARKAEGRGMVVGDVLRCSWGYDQTNVDYYQVTKLVGSTMVEIRAIGSEAITTGYDCGKCVPMVDNFKGEAKRYVAKGGSVRIASYASAHVMTPKAEVAGVKVYGSSYWSSYA